MFIILLFLFPIPVIGTAVRYRATYYPRLKDQDTSLPETHVVVNGTTPSPIYELKDTSHPSLDLEARGDTKVAGDVIISDVPIRRPPTFFGVFMNVWRHEHFEGLFQGYLFHLILTMTTTRFYISPTFLPFVDGKYTILPFNILYIYYLAAGYRLIVSPQKFKPAEPINMFRLTFTEYERAHPFKFLQYCGLVIPFFLNLGFTKYLYNPAINWNTEIMDNPFYTPPGEEGEWYKYLLQPNWYSWARIGLYVITIVVSTLIWAPVHVILTRLAMQQMHGPLNEELVEERDTGKLAEKGLIAASSYLQLTTEQRPYLGFRDCFTRIVQDEGWGVFYRCWWLTTFGFMTRFLQ